MNTAQRFWTRRLRWRLLGAWRWPLFIVVTVADGFIAHALPPTGGRAQLVPSMIIASFTNLFLIGLVAPWLARRLAARQGIPAGPATFPPAGHAELLTDRLSALLLVIAAIGLVAAGLGNKKVVVADTDRQARAGAAAQAFAEGHGSPEIRHAAEQGNIDTHPLLEDGFFRMCVPYNDPRRQFCMFVDSKLRPPSVSFDHDSRPNQQYFHTPAPG